MEKEKSKEYYLSLKKEYIPCTVCDSSKHVVVFNDDRYNMGIKTVMCKHCGFVFTNPRPTSKEMESFYRENYRRFYFGYPDPGSDEYQNSVLRQIALSRAEWLGSFVRDELVSEVPSVLDIGCGEGAFLNLMGKAYASKCLYGIEPDPVYAEYAGKTNGANVTVGVNALDFIQENQNMLGSFDLVLLSHVLEHIYNPIEVLAQIKSLLKDDGILCVEVPNLGSSAWSGNGMFHIAHVNHFSSESLTTVLSLSGFECIKSFTGSHPVDPWAMTFLFKKTKGVLIRQPIPKCGLAYRFKVYRHIYKILRSRYEKKYGVIMNIRDNLVCAIKYAVAGSLWSQSIRPQ